ncbi:SAM-dependent methyltransferase [Brachybacterium sp. P6-10-X1]|uniref:tRNA (adenine-N1)-methyltransferase n=1 Tax=Brachybacterium sp. P6-10-X1 TaxID=1903186 RepID=UPI0009717A7F|nr:tRNA (adenine-N1)-methyltransferase [Brachybacterium sp. P6-10-X1]APX31953.1 SAM-dependent methyltransferase [Brachybacterium sp. P6-10-X1]
MTQQPTPRAPRRGLDRTGSFDLGDKVQLADTKNRRHTITLRPGGQFHTHRGVLEHDQLIGAEDGVVVEDSRGTRYQALRPLYADYMLSMPRGAAIIYPKDTAQILMWGDIFPGARVLEAGVGSGGLTTALLRAVGEEGSVHSIERREDFAEVARENVETYFGAPHPSWDLTVGDFQDVAPALCPDGPAVDRVVLDMLAPWECIDAAAEVLVSGGVFLTYVATVTQLSRTAEALRDHGEFTEPTAWESFVRPWHLEGLAVRPEHRMNAHTGFLLTSRRTAHGTPALTRVTRPAPGSRVEEELADPANEGFGGASTEWGPQDVGERGVAPRKLKRALRDIRQGRDR